MALTTPTAAPTNLSAAHAEQSVGLHARYESIRRQTHRLAARLSPEDCVVQSMPDASPVKWHLAHTTWFYEEFILRQHAPGYDSFHPQFSFLFNSYYNQVGKRIARPKRGLMTRPSLEEVMEYREHVDASIDSLLANCDPELLAKIVPILEIGLNHEQQHQELILTDVKHMLSWNPLKPAYCTRQDSEKTTAPPDVQWIKFDGGLHDIGHDESGAGFAYDNEGPRHRVFLQPFALASRLVTCGEFIEFINAGGYEKPELWLDMGWGTVLQNKWGGPMYWEQRDGQWWQFTLAGMTAVDFNEPVTHVSLFEADAFARWSDARLPTEQEWEVASTDVPIQGNFVESDCFHPLPLGDGRGEGVCQVFGDVWEWTRSQYSPYPGYAPPKGAIGEYNGKFMCNQFVLRGGSCATPISHIRRTYRNFFSPEARWQFTGIRMAKDLT